jgi:hypothetical protein
VFVALLAYPGSEPAAAQTTESSLKQSCPDATRAFSLRQAGSEELIVADPASTGKLRQAALLFYRCAQNESDPYMHQLFLAYYANTLYRVGKNTNDARAISLAAATALRLDSSQFDDVRALVAKINVSLSRRQSAPTATPVPVGSVSGVITWQYNEYVGTKGDSEANVALFPSPMRVKVDDSDVPALSLAVGTGSPNADLQQKYGMVVGRCDGNGDITLDNVPAGHYAALIVSAKTRRDFNEPLMDVEIQLLSWIFADDQGRDDFIGNIAARTNLMSGILLQKWAFEFVTVTPGETAHFSHDFGNTYI